MTCPHCGSSDFTTTERQFSNGTKHVEQRCINGHFQKFLPTGRPLEAMPYGKYCGKPLKDLPDDYLDWLLTKAELKNNIRRHLEAEYERRGTVDR